MSKTALDDLIYDHETGYLWWSCSGKGRKLDTPVGTVSPNGYRNLTLNRKQYKAHHVVWYLAYGYWPTQIDHINRNKDDNRLENLREVDCSLQQHNRKMPLPSSGLTGAHWNKAKNKFKSSIKVDGKNVHLGYFNTAKEASKAYLKEKSKCLRL